MTNYKGISIGIIAKIGIPPPTARKLSPDPRSFCFALAFVAFGSVSGSTGVPLLTTLTRNADDGELTSHATDDRTSRARARPVDRDGACRRHRHRLGRLQEADASRAERAELRCGDFRLGFVGPARHLRRTGTHRGDHPLPAGRR